MSFINFLGLEDPSYGNVAKGVLYVIYDILWKIIHAVGSLIDVITGLFYKLAGENYLGSGGSELVEEQDFISRLFNTNIISSFSLFMMIASVVLMTVFGAMSILKRHYLSKQEAGSVTDIIKNMVLATIFLICLTPFSLFLISSISAITSAIIGVFSDSSNVSLADLLFTSSFSGDAIEAYNAMYSAEITNWTEITENGFLFDLAYGNTEVTFYWYVYLLGAGVILYNLVIIVFGLVKRIFNTIVLYLVAPVYAAKMVDDGGNKFKEWKNKAIPELISIVGTVLSFMILISLVGLISDIELVSTTVTSDANAGLLTGEPVTTTINPTAVLTNNLARVFLLMGGISVAKDAGELLGNAFRGANDDSASLLEGIFNKVSTKEYVRPSGNNGQTGPKTRIITKTTTTTRNITDFSANVAVEPNKTRERPINVVTNQRNTFNTSLNSIDRHIDNIQNRSNVSFVERSGETSNVKVGAYRNQASNGVEIKPTDALNQTFMKSYKAENNKLRNEWNLLKGKNTTSSTMVIKEFESASKDLDSALSTGNPQRVKESMNNYVNAYKNEEKMAKEGYREFAGKSAKLSNDLSVKQQTELKNISTAYRKAQVDYGKTARKLSEVSKGNMSVSDALNIKEKADKQREKLMEASSRASEFYNKQKKGE